MSKAKTLVGFRAPLSEWLKFKVRCYEEGYKMTDVLSAMVKLFISNEEFRKRIIEYLKGSSLQQD